MNRAAAFAASLFLAVSLVGCGGEEEPAAICDSAESLKGSVEDVLDIDLTAPGSISDVESSLTEVGNALADVKSEAKSEFAAPLAAVETSFATLGTSVEAAVSSTSAATLSAASSALTTFGSDVESLVNDVEATC